MFSLTLNQRVVDQEGSAVDIAENDLIHTAVKGNLASFNQLVILHQDSLFWWAYSLVNDETLAEDITQSTFITAYEKLSAFRSGSFKGWLFTIARNRSYDELRRKKRRPSVSLEDATEEDHNWLETLRDSALLPEDALLVSEQSEMIERMIRNLPEVFQQVVRLIDLEGLDYQDAAKILDLPLGTVKSRLTRARLKLRDMFQQSRWL